MDRHQDLALGVVEIEDVHGNGGSASAVVLWGCSRRKEGLHAHHIMRTLQWVSCWRAVRSISYGVDTPLLSLTKEAPMPAFSWDLVHGLTSLSVLMHFPVLERASAAEELHYVEEPANIPFYNLWHIRQCLQDALRESDVEVTAEEWETMLRHVVYFRCVLSRSALQTHEEKRRVQSVTDLDTFGQMFRQTRGKHELPVTYDGRQERVSIGIDYSNFVCGSTTCDVEWNSQFCHPVANLLGVLGAYKQFILAHLHEGEVPSRPGHANPFEGLQEWDDLVFRQQNAFTLESLIPLVKEHTVRNFHHISNLCQGEPYAAAARSSSFMQAGKSWNLMSFCKGAAPEKAHKLNNWVQQLTSPRTPINLWTLLLQFSVQDPRMSPAVVKRYLCSLYGGERNCLQALENLHVNFEALNWEDWEVEL